MTGRLGSGSYDLLLQLVIFTHAIREYVAAILSFTSIVVRPERCVSAAYRLREQRFAQKLSWKVTGQTVTKDPKCRFSIELVFHCLKNRACVSLFEAAPRTLIGARAHLQQKGCKVL